MSEAQAYKLEDDPVVGYALSNPLASLLELDRLDAEESLASYVKFMWSEIIPDQLAWGRAFEVVCEILEDITYGHLRRVIINEPPGMSKSLFTGVFWPTWEWGPRNMPHLIHVGTSNNLDLAVATNRLCKELIQTPKYQALWGHRVRLKDDQAAKRRFLLEGGGGRQVIPFDRPIGWRGHRVVIDDPNVIDEPLADTVKVRRRMGRSMPSRLADPETGAMLLIQQRTGLRDATDAVKKAWSTAGDAFEHAVFGMRYKTVAGVYKASAPVSKRDWRTEVGEPIAPERYSDQAEEELREAMRTEGGVTAEAAQLDQDPLPEGAGVFQREWFEKHKIPSAPTEPRRRVRAWDLAATEEVDSAWTVGLLLSRRAVRAPLNPDGTPGRVSYRWAIEDIVRFRGKPGKVRDMIGKTAERDGHDVEISIPIDPGQAGLAQREDFAGMLAGYKVSFTPEGRKSKPERAGGFAAQCEAGTVDIVEGPFFETFVSEAELFPNGPFLDQIDAGSRAFNHFLIKPQKGLAPKGPRLLESEIE